jgi:arginine-tRNA-protein transferase
MKPTRNVSLNFYTTPAHGCSYLPNRQAVTLFADPGIPKSDPVYGLLSAHGFRRSGEHLYRPHCHTCRACVPVRVPVAEFVPNRHQRRTWLRNTDLSVRPTPARFNTEHFDLYQRYLAGRHRGGGMDNPSPQQYLDFLTASWASTRFLEIRLGNRLLGVAVVDFLSDALSAVYTFYEPNEPARSLGKFSVLYEIEAAREAGLQWLYLGYWIEDSRKMRYKVDFQPLEYFWDGQWTRSRPSFPRTESC